MKNKAALISLFALFILVLLSAFNQQPARLFAIPLPEGRSLDETHDTGHIDWSGSVGYINLFHRDGLCPSGCTEQVTRIINGSSVSGAFAGDLDYFEVMVAASHSSSVGTAVLTACSSSNSLNLYAGPGGGPPGFVSFSMVVPSGCTSWSLSASGGYVDFRSVDANYGTPPVPTDTPIPSETFTLIPSFTPTPTESPTGTMTPTETLTSTPSETLLPGVTPSDTPIPTITPTPSPTGTPTITQTLPPGVTPSNTFTPSPTKTRTLPAPSSGSGGGRTPTPAPGGGVLPSTTQIRPSPSGTRSISSGPSPTGRTTVPGVAQGGEPVAFSLEACIPSVPGGTGSASGQANNAFPWLGLAAGLGSLAGAASLLRALQQSGSGGSAIPAALTVSVPHLVQRKTTVGEWVSRPVKTLVQITRTVWRTITEAIPRFIDVMKRVVERVFHSEWVTTFKQVAKTVYKSILEKVPLLSWLGAIIGFIWKTVIKPFITWVTEAIRTLRTWVENVVRWVVQRIQDGWNYITRQVAETIREWVEKTDWVRQWITKEITVWETEWETVAVPIPSWAQSLATANWSLLARLVPTVGLATISLALCSVPPQATPTPTPDYVATAVFCLQQTMVAEALTAEAAASVTPPPSATPTLTPYTVTVGPGQTLSYFAALFGISEAELMAANNMTDPNALQAGQALIIPINTDHLSGILADLLRNERPTDVPSQEAWGALNVLTNGQAYPNAWWMQDGQLTAQDMLALVINGETASNPKGYEAVVGRYVYYCGVTPDCNGNTTNLLTFLTYYQAWREPIHNEFFANENPQSEEVAEALVNGDTAQLQHAGLSASLDPGNPDLPFHNANVSDNWNTLLISKLGRQPDDPTTKFWVLSISDLKKLCGIDYGVLSPDMTTIDVLPACQ